MTTKTKVKPRRRSKVLDESVRTIETARSLERYYAIVEDQTEMICRFEPDCTLTFINEAYCRYFGRSREELVGRSFLTLVPEEDHQTILDNLSALNCENPVRMYEHRVIKADGSVGWQQWSDRAICDSHGNVFEYQSVGRDITERKEAEIRARDAERLLHAIIDHSPSVIFLKDLQGRYVLANRAMGAVLGRDIKDIVGKTDHELLPRHVADAYRDVDRQVLDAGKPMQFEETAPHRDSIQPYLTIKFPLLDEEGAPYALGGIATNVLELKQTAEELEQRLRFERLLFELSASFINIATEDVDARINHTLRRLGKFMDVDRCFIDQFSDDKCEFRVTHFWAHESLEPDDFLGEVLLNEEVPWYTARMLSGQSLIFSHVDEVPDEAAAEKAYIRRVGIKSSVIVPLIVDGDVIGDFGIDVIRSERVWTGNLVQGLQVVGGIFGNALVRKRTEKKLRTAEQEARQNREELAHLTRVQIMGEMAAGIAHEINQPLAAIENYAQAAEKRLQGATTTPDKIRELVIKIREQTNRAGNVLTRLRAMVKRQPVAIKQADINAVVRETIELAGMEAQLHDCRLELETEPSLPPVAIDRIQIQQVVLNLIRNALEASANIRRKKEKIVLVKTTKNSADYVEVSVTDAGLGLTDMEAERLFEPFFSTKRAGLGMGLSVSRSIIAMHGGKIWHSSSPCGGTIFHFSLPLDSEEGAA